MTDRTSLRFRQARLAELAPILREEDAWGEHPECPVEVLADGSQVWRVPPGTEVEHVVATGPERVRLMDPKKVRPILAPEPRHIAIEFVHGGEQWWADWRYLRRIGYTPRPAREDQAEAAHATR